MANWGIRYEIMKVRCNGEAGVQTKQVGVVVRSDLLWKVEGEYD